jgi:hypothetical protein
MEGHIRRLKLIKRQMYGRAQLDLLRIRVMYAASFLPLRAAGGRGKKALLSPKVRKNSFK